MPGGIREDGTARFVRSRPLLAATVALAVALAAPGMRSGNLVLGLAVVAALTAVVVCCVRAGSEFCEIDARGVVIRGFRRRDPLVVPWTEIRGAGLAHSVGAGGLVRATSVLLDTRHGMHNLSFTPSRALQDAILSGLARWGQW